MEAALPARVACVGTGTVGASFAALFLARGLEVRATDPAADEATLRRRIDAAWPALEAVGLAPGASPERLSFTTSLADALDGAAFVQESAPERESVKLELLAEVDRLTPSGVVVASSTSGLLASRLQTAMRHPERLVVGHPFNPPHLMPLVEVVAGGATGEWAVERAEAFYRALGKQVVRVRKEVIGHIANRLQAAIFREALHLLHEGAASVADIDAAMLYGPGPRLALMGPFLTFHLAGGEGGMAHFVEHLAEPYNAWFADLGDDTLGPDDGPTLVEGIAAELAGRSVRELSARRDEALVRLLNEIEPL